MFNIFCRLSSIIKVLAFLKSCCSSNRTFFTAEFYFWIIILGGRSEECLCWERRCFRCSEWQTFQLWPLILLHYVRGSVIIPQPLPQAKKNTEIFHPHQQHLVCINWNGSYCCIIQMQNITHKFIFHTLIPHSNTHKHLKLHAYFYYPSPSHYKMDQIYPPPQSPFLLLRCCAVANHSNSKQQQRLK